MSPAERGENSDPSGVTVFTIGDSFYFPGLVALVNSLRLTGFHHPVFVLDCGLTPEQRDLLGPHCHLVEAPRRAMNPLQYKAFAHLLRPSGIVVIIDSDIIVARSLDPLVQLAHQGKVCVFPDPERHRWFPEWQQLFGLRAQLRREGYVNSGFAAWSTAHWPELLERWWQCCERIFAYRTFREGAGKAEPAAQGDQEALNALLMSEIPEGAVARQPEQAEVFRRKLCRVEVVDTGTLASRYDGQVVTLLHNNGDPKLWGRKAWRRVSRKNAYVRLMRRLLNGSDVAISLPGQDLPVWLRPGIAARTTTSLLYALNPLITAALLPRRVVRSIRSPVRVPVYSSP
jgi:hypothetical protein